MSAPILVLVTDPRYQLEHTVSAVRRAARGLGRGRLVVQLRDKGATEASLLASALCLREVTRDTGALLVINGPVAVATAAGADGVHLPNEGVRTADRVGDARARLGAGAFVTTNAHDDADVRHAVVAGATAVLVSPVFETPGKGVPRGVAAIASARAIVDAARQTPRLLVFALGGVTRENAAACAEAGADGVAAIRALHDEHDALALRALAEPFAAAGRSRTP